ncbi:MAG TPA: FG-GAP-like repeat-containing protein [Candidatus Acidoferrales bacterium]|nr:FG-GAP-like repeat-containing protein [Candidatus Acidoferrales bacterium]
MNYIQEGARSGTLTVALADFNGDGKLDIVAAQNGSIDEELAVLLGNGDGTFQAPILMLPCGSLSCRGAQVVLVGDFNGDGKPDIAAGIAGVSGGSDTWTILLGNGDGTFTLKSTLSLPSGAVGGATVAGVVGDFNGDGKLDLVVTDSSDEAAYLYLGNGDGTFQSPATIAAGNFPNAVIAADVNNDGHLDIVTTGSGGSVGPFGSCISVILGNGNGTFQMQTSYATYSGPTAITLADFNGDHNLDAAVLTNGGYMSILLGNGNGTFQAATNIGIGLTAAASGPEAIVAADVNKDGKQDLILSIYGQDCVAVFLGKGTGSFQSPLFFNSNQMPTGLAVGDFNGDAKLDWVSGSGSIDAVYAALGNGDGTFRAPQGVPAALSASQTFAAGNFTSAKILDLAVADRGNSRVDIYLGNGNGGFTLGNTYTFGGYDPYSITTGDFNGDGKLDLAVGLTAGCGAVAILLGNGNGSFQAPQYYTCVSLSPTQIAAADVNKDGKLDLVVNDTSSTSLYVMLGNGNGTFQSAVATPSVGSNSGYFAVADLNADGKPDLAVSDYADNSVSILLGNGDGTFGSPTLAAAGSGPFSVAVGDFNGDGKPDLAVADFAGDTLAVALGNGNGTFQSPTTYSVCTTTDTCLSGAFPYTVIAADFNKDGKLDVLVGDQDAYVSNAFLGLAYNNGFQLFLGNGDGTFQSAQPYMAGFGALYALAADVDGNGTPDVVLADPGDYMANVLLNLTPAASATPATLTFAAEAIGKTSTPKSATFTNLTPPGGASMTPPTLSITGADAGDFAISGNKCTNTLAPRGKCTVSLTFTAAGIGKRSASLLFTDGAWNSPQKVSLSGTGPDFSITASPSSLSVSPGNSVNSTLTLTPLNGFNDVITMSCAGAPKNSTCSISPAMVGMNGVSAQSATFTLSTASTTKAGTYRVTPKGISGADSHSVTITVTVQ